MTNTGNVRPPIGLRQLIQFYSRDGRHLCLPSEARKRLLFYTIFSIFRSRTNDKKHSFIKTHRCASVCWCPKHTEAEFSINLCFNIAGHSNWYWYSFSSGTTAHSRYARVSSKLTARESRAGGGSTTSYLPLSLESCLFGPRTSRGISSDTLLCGSSRISVSFEPYHNIM